MFGLEKAVRKNRLMLSAEDRPIEGWTDRDKTLRDFTDQLVRAGDDRKSKTLFSFKTF